MPWKEREVDEEEIIARVRDRLPGLWTDSEQQAMRTLILACRGGTATAAQVRQLVGFIGRGLLREP